MRAITVVWARNSLEEAKALFVAAKAMRAAGRPAFVVEPRLQTVARIVCSVADALEQEQSIPVLPLGQYRH